MAPRRILLDWLRGDQRARTEVDRALARAGVLRERVAGRVCVVPHGGHDQVRAVERNHARLGQPRAWVGLLHGWEDAGYGNDDAEDKVEHNEELVERARLAREEAVHESRERNGNCVHSRGWADEDPLPEVRLGVFPIFRP